MSSYTTTKSIEGYYMGFDLDKSELVTKSEVKAWITEYSILIDTNLRRKYTLPISNVNDKVVLQLLVEKFVVGKLDGIMRQSASVEERKYLRNRELTKEANEMMADLISGKLQLETPPKNLAPIGYLQGNYDN